MALTHIKCLGTRPSLLGILGFILGSWGMVGLSWAQIGDVRHSRILPPGLSDVSRVGIHLQLNPVTPRVHTASLEEVVKSRLEQLGYRVVLTPNPNLETIWLEVICEFPRGGQHSHPGSATTPDSPVPRSLWASPPCHLAYTYRGEPMPWLKMDRFIYAEGVSVMTHIGSHYRVENPYKWIHAFLHHYDFPILLAAEWGHVPRLLHVLSHPDTSLKRQRLIMKTLGELQAPKAYPMLVEKLQDEKVAKAAARALGEFGLRAQATLLQVLQTATDPLLQAAAASGLGRIAGTTGDSSPTPLFLEMVASPTVDIQVKTELVWALGKAPDFRAFAPLTRLSQTLWAMYSQDPQIQRLREAVEWSIREVKQGGHGDDY